MLTAIATPFREDGGVDFDAFQRLALYLVENGSDGLVVAGTTGESPTLDDDERIDLIRAGGRSGRRSRDRPRRHRHERHAPLDPHDRGGAQGRRRRVPRRHAVLQQAAAARHRRALRGGREGERPPDRRLQHPEPRRRQHRARDDLAPRRDRDGASGQAGKRRPRAGAAHRGERARPLRRRRRPARSRSSSSAPSGGSASTPTSSGRRSPSRCARREGDLERARELDRELAPVYELLRIATNPIPIKAALNLLGHDVGGYRLPLVPPTAEELSRVRDCLARLGLLVAA